MKATTLLLLSKLAKAETLMNANNLVILVRFIKFCTIMVDIVKK